ncbi:MAG TPA: Ger(x)C family spore germination protein [Symbiobacteriaceae bacterium]|nr:Ger(x)C family spore germination protein [Symbiobacteriaceae bacterium]
MVRRRPLVWLMLLLLVLSGCWSRVELNDLGIVSEVGLDRTGDGQIRVAAGIVVPGRVGTPGSVGGSRPFAEAPVAVMTETGADVMEALTRLQYRVPRRLYWGHLQVVILGEDVARAGMGPLLDFWTRHRRPRLSGYVVAVRGEALQFLQAKPLLRRLPGDALKEILRSPVGVEITLIDVVRALSSGMQDPLLPSFGVGRAYVREGAPTSENVLTGAALFREDRLIGWLDQRQLRDLQWLRGEVRTGTITIDLGQEGRISLEAYRVKSELEPRLQGNQLVATLRAEVEADLGESTTRIDLSRTEAVQRMERMAGKAIETRLQETFARLAREEQVDPMGLMLRLRRSDPASWARIRGRWRDVLGRATLRVESQIYIRRTGRHGPPLHLPREERTAP